MNGQRSLPKRIATALACGLLTLVLTLLPGGIWSALLVANLSISPALPWAVVAMALLLWLMWQYLNGRWWPQSTAQWRHRHLRATALPRRVFVLALVAGALSIVALTGFWIVLFQLVKAPGNALPDFGRYPPFTVALVLLMASFMGALSEEAGIRGYLQSILERDFGGPAAIVLAAIVMAPGHALTQGFVWPTMLFYLFVDVMFGVTAYLTQSILPGIVVHTAGLLTFFWLVWPHDAARHMFNAGGDDAWFWIHAAQALLFAAAAVLAFGRLAAVARNPPAV